MSLLKNPPAAVSRVGSETPLMEVIRSDALADRCSALLTKGVLDNTASLYAYAEHLGSTVPSGKQAYEVIVKSYVYGATRRIILRGGDQ